MDIGTVATTNAPAPGGAYSQARIFGPFVMAAGQVGINPETGRLAEGTQAQVVQATRNLEQVLLAAGSRLSDVVKTTCFLADIGDFAEFDAAYRELFPQPLPARSTVGVALAANLRFEIEAIAVRRGTDEVSLDGLT
jgi:2-iminobutanoate/2-iminopropanoate deaminase